MTHIAPSGGVKSYRQFEYSGPTAHDIFKVRGGLKIPGGYVVHCWGTGHKHGDRNPSLHISGGPGERPRLHCYAGCDYRDLAAHPVMQGAFDGHRYTGPAYSLAAQNDDSSNRAWKLDTLRKCFAGSKDISGTIAERYLTDKRGVGDAIDDELAMTTRYAPDVIYGSGDNRATAPTIVSIMRPVVETMDRAFGEYFDEPDRVGELMLDRSLWVKLHRLRLTEDGRKAGDATMFGQADNAVMFLTSPTIAAHRQVLTVAEGLETALSAKRRGFHGVIAAGNSGNIAALPVIDGIRHLFLCVERDEASRRAIGECGNRWSRSGVEVRLITPASGAKDLNDEDRGLAQ